MPDRSLIERVKANQSFDTTKLPEDHMNACMVQRVMEPASCTCLAAHVWHSTTLTCISRSERLVHANQTYSVRKRCQQAAAPSCCILAKCIYAYRMHCATMHQVSTGSCRFSGCDRSWSAFLTVFLNQQEYREPIEISPFLVVSCKLQNACRGLHLNLGFSNEYC
jgi:hypothetical protein